MLVYQRVDVYHQTSAVSWNRHELPWVLTYEDPGSRRHPLRLQKNKAASEHCGTHQKGDFDVKMRINQWFWFYLIF